MFFDSDIDVGFPFALDGRGRVTDPDYEQHVRDMIELLLFTSPGERVNRPEFGCGLLEALFDKDDEQEVAVIQFEVQGALQRWLAEVISVELVEVTVGEDECSLVVKVDYHLLRDRQYQAATFEARGLPWDL